MISEATFNSNIRPAAGTRSDHGPYPLIDITILHSVLDAMAATNASAATVIAVVRALTTAGPAVATVQQPPATVAAAEVAIALPVEVDLPPSISGGMGSNSASASSLSLSSSNSINRTYKNKKTKKEEIAESPGLHALPGDWQIKQSHLIMARRHKISEIDVRILADDLCDWANSKAVLKADWDAYFNTWIRRKATRDPAQHRLPLTGAGLLTVVPKRGGSIYEDAANEALADLRRKLVERQSVHAGGVSGEANPGDRVGENPSRCLSA